MCHLCRTRDLCDRLEGLKQRLADAGKANSSQLIHEAIADLTRYHNAAAASDAVLSGSATVEVVEAGQGYHPGSGGVH